ncbi:MAG TPA: hypothetical protein VFH56_03450 [Acidimicrobiales bacterium]|nr:hypothetical protein [Acidimicrobiales bacterium]
MTTDYVNHPENPTNSNLVAHALRELDIIGETSHEEPSMRRCVVEIIRTFAEQGHSGSSAAWLANVLDRLMRFKPLTEITNDPSEWFDHGNNLWQNIRDGEAFSNDGGQTYRLNSDHDRLQVAAGHE